jgi:ABC-type phosphate transport system substrate-binding protein
MDMSLGKRFASGWLAVLVVGGLLGCMAFAGTASAAAPSSGLNCVASEGKINGRGSTFQKIMILNYANAYREDYCGETPSGGGSNSNGEAGNTMVAYNYPAAESAGATGSGAGEKAIDCRTDAFAGTDVPYTKVQLEEMDGEAGKGKELGGSACKIAFTPPFQPNSPAEWPVAADSTAKVMSFPIGGSAVSIDVRFGATACGGKAPTASLNFTPSMLSKIFGGDYKEWGEVYEASVTEKVAGDEGLKECKGLKITRVVRQDNSGTTNIFKFYLEKVAEARTGAVCGVFKGKTEPWSAYNNPPNNVWPGTVHPGEEGECTEVVHGEKSGNPELLKKLESIEGGIGYTDLADAVKYKEEHPTSGIFFNAVQNSTGSSFQQPKAGNGANCEYKGITVPGTSAGEFVGLNPEESWANNNPEGNHGNVTNEGAKYPICGLTWDLVYEKLDNGSVANPISRLTADQRRTEYSFFTFILSSTAQETLSSIDYAPLPTGVLGKLREGFQSNF